MALIDLLTTSKWVSLLSTTLSGIHLISPVIHHDSTAYSVPVYRISDAEAVSMSRYLVHNDGLFLGSSSACNLFACVKFVKKMGWHKGERIVTILYVICTRSRVPFSAVMLIVIVSLAVILEADIIQR